MKTGTKHAFQHSYNPANQTKDPKDLTIESVHVHDRNESRIENIEFQLKMAEKSVSLDCLPFEVIEKIFYCEDISFIDLCRLSRVCQIFNCIAKNNKLWKNKYTLKWPALSSMYDANNTDWKSEFRIKHESKIAVSTALQGMTVQSDDTFLQYTELLGGHPLTDHIIIDDLEDLIYISDRYINLTLKYNAKKVLRYMRQRVLKNIWQNLLTAEPQSLTLLKGACLISRWCQAKKRDCMGKVFYILNDILKRVYEKLVVADPEHPVIKMGLPILKDDNGKVLEKSLWTPSEIRRILLTINEVMYNAFHFHANVRSYYSPENSFIDKVLESNEGIPIILGIIYQTVAAQFGVVLLPVNFPSRFLLKWLEHPHLSGIEAYTFIDVYDNGSLKTTAQLQDLAPDHDRFATEWVETVTPLKVFIKMCWNLVEVGRQNDGEGDGLLCLCDALELLSILSPDDTEPKLLLTRVYIHLSINMIQVISMLQEISERDPLSAGIVGIIRSAITILETQRIRSKNKNPKTKCFRRDAAPGVQFAVGMIMRHKKYDYRCVIYDWDVVCSAGDDWIKQMGVHNLSYKDQQPFYHVLVEDGTNRYAAQENLEIDQQGTIVRHQEVGRFFQSFHGHYYLPNDQKLQEYPDDVEARELALRCIKVDLKTYADS